MKKSVLSVLAILFLTIGAGGAYAGAKNNKEYSVSDGGKVSDSDGGKPTARAVPEIDAASGTLALAFVGGVLLLGAERLRRRSQRAN